MIVEVGDEPGGLTGRLFRERAHLVSHTHWDREWYLPLGRFRQRLVALIDELLDAPLPEGSFLLDGQTVLLEDYLSVRPERASELSAQLRAGQLEAGPWYVLADELIPSGEALIRNLLAGRRALRMLRADAPPVLYCPDSFGHPASLPLLAQGFGCPLIILWRGFGSARWPMSDVVRWRAGDGTEALVYHLPPSGYEAGANLPADVAEAAERWRQLRDALFARSQTGVVLIPNGADHHARQSSLDDAVRALQTVASPVKVVRSSLRGFAADLADAARRHELPVVRGELRDSYGYTWTLQGTFASRAYQKRHNAIVERMLIRECEPFAAIAQLLGAHDSRPLLNAAWRTLLQCHPHDTLCGCSIDDVASAMDARLADAEAQARGLRRDAVERIIGHDPTFAGARRDQWIPTAVIRNLAARLRGGVAELELDTPLYRVPVGPGSRPAAPPRIRRRPLSLGTGVPLQILSRRVLVTRTESPRQYPAADMTERAQVLAWVAPIAGYGTTSYPIAGTGSSALHPGFIPVTASGASIDNGMLRISVTSSGQVRLTELRTNRVVDSLISFEDIGDRGDLYTHSPIAGTASEARPLDAKVIHEGPLRGEMDLRFRMTLPSARVAMAGSARRVRATPARITITATLSLDAGANFVRVGVRGANTARDHRLRIVFSTGVANASVHADAAFGPVHRLPLQLADEEYEVEANPSTAPLHRHVSVFASDRGATLYSDGLAEYEAHEDGRIAVTLVRAVGQLSRNDLPERPGHAGWPAESPKAQCLHSFEGRFALMLHGPREDDTADLIERTADDVLLPLRGFTLRSAIAIQQATEGIELLGEGLSFSCAKPSEDGTWIVLRCINHRDRAVRGEWHLPRAITDARFARLDETPLETISVDPNGSRVPFNAPPLGTVTVLVR